MKRWIQQNIIWRGTIRRIKHYGSGACIDHFPPSYSGEETVQIMKEKNIIWEGELTSIPCEGWHEVVDYFLERFNLSYWLCIN